MKALVFVNLESDRLERCAACSSARYPILETR
jgi:hypothetical protein